MISKTDVMTSKRRPDVMHETTFPSPGRIHGNSGQVCKKEQSDQVLHCQFVIPSVSLLYGMVFWIFFSLSLAFVAIS